MLSATIHLLKMARESAYSMKPNNGSAVKTATVFSVSLLFANLSESSPVFCVLG
jgi:hypothetical protein